MGFLTLPLALIGLVALPTLGAIYYFRHRFRRQPITTMLFFREQLRLSSEGRRVEKIQLPLLFFLELLAILLLLGGVAGPLWRREKPMRSLAVVLDDSYSMQAVGAGGSCRERAVAFLKEEYGKGGQTRLLLITAGERARLLGQPVYDWADAGRLLEQWGCEDDRADVAGGLSLAYQLAPSADMLVLSDRLPDDVAEDGGGVMYRAFGVRPSGNVSLTAATRQDGEGGDRVFLQVENFGEKSAAVRLALVQEGEEGGEQVLKEETLGLAAGGRRRLFYEVPGDGKAVRARVRSEGDVLSGDDAVMLVGEEREVIRVRLTLGDKALYKWVRQALEAVEGVVISSDGAHLHITDMVEGAGEGSVFELVFHPVENAVSYVGPFVVDRRHSLLEALPLEGVVWAGPAVESAGDDSDGSAGGDGDDVEGEAGGSGLGDGLADGLAGTPLVMVGGHVLLTEERLPAVSRYHIYYDVAGSTMHLTAGWPILFSNLVEDCRERQPGMRERNLTQHRRGEFTVPVGAERLRVLRPDGEELVYELAGLGGATLELPTDAAGRYLVRCEYEDAAEEDVLRDMYVVNRLNAVESDLRGTDYGEAGSFAGSQMDATTAVNYSWVFILGALAVLMLHHYLLTKWGSA